MTRPASLSGPRSMKFAMHWRPGSRNAPARRVVIERPRLRVENGIDRVAHPEKRAVGGRGVDALYLRIQRLARAGEARTRLAQVAQVHGFA